MNTKLVMESYRATVKTEAQVRTPAHGQKSAWSEGRNAYDGTFPREQAVQGTCVLDLGRDVSLWECSLCQSSNLDLINIKEESLPDELA